MQKFKYLFSILILVAIAFTGCQKESNSVAPEFSNTASLNKFMLPTGATLVSAILYVHNYAHFNANPVNIHRITAPWQEYVVTYNNFGGAYSGTIEDFLSPGGVGNDFRFADVTTLVQSWLNGTNMNYGLLLDQPNIIDDLAEYSSRETGANAPYLEICYSLNGNIVCDTTRAIADTYIWGYPDEGDDDLNFGTENILFTGYRNGYKKQTLVQFGFEATPPEVNCETAYANGPNATCFLDIPNKQGNNWGWTNKITGSGSWNFPIYAGAGQCDLSKGTLVGTLDVTYSGSTVTVFYNINSGFTLDETHLWIGSGMLPVKNGKYVSNPGGFNHNGQNPVSVNITAPFYIAAHSVVCGQY